MHQTIRDRDQGPSRPSTTVRRISHMEQFRIPVEVLLHHPHLAHTSQDHLVTVQVLLVYSN